MALISIYNPNGKLQFDDEMLTVACKATGQAVVEARQVGNSSPRSVMIPNTAGFTGFVALGGGEGYCAALAGRWQGGNRIYATNAPLGTVFNYYLYQTANNIPDVPAALVIRDGNNKVTFSSGQRIMSVMTLLSAGGSFTASGKTLAYAQGEWAGNRFYSGLRPSVGNPDRYDYTIVSKAYGGVIANGGQTVNTSSTSWGDATVRGGVEPPDEIDRDLTLFVCDVTDFPIGATFF